MFKRYMVLGFASMVLAASAAQAQVTGSLGGGTGPFSTLSGAGLDGGATATRSGGAVLASDQPFADIPAGGVFGGTFLAAGPTVGQPAILTFTAPLSYLSFLWGSPDMYNSLTLTTNTGASSIFTVTSLGFAVTNGNQAFSQYVEFSPFAGQFITSAAFTNIPSTDAFEVANFQATAAVPEPATWAMMLLGFGAVGFSVRRKRASLMQAA